MGPPIFLPKAAIFAVSIAGLYRILVKRLIQRLDSSSVAPLVSMVVALGHSHGLVTGDVVDLLDRDAEVQQSCDKGVPDGPVLSGLIGAGSWDFLCVSSEFQSIPAQMICR